MGIRDLLIELREILEITLFNKWLWIVICSMCAVAVLPLFIMHILLTVPQWLSITLTILIIIGWGVAGGYKEYLLYKRKREEAKAKGEEFNASLYDEYLEKRRRYRARP